METLQYNYYDILEVSPFCAQHEVTTAYERAKTTYSGDNPAIYTIFTDEEAREMLNMIEEAFLVLGNKMLRALYDEKLGTGKTKAHDVSFETLQAQSKIVFKESPKRSVSTQIEYEVDAQIENQLNSISDWSGEELKKAREYKKLSLEKLSAITKVTPFYLNALEEMNPEHLPALVFVRGYVGQVAKVLGLKEKVVVESYMSKYKIKIGKK